jgi:uncharacterized protein (TIGR00369 family)
MAMDRNPNRAEARSYSWRKPDFDPALAATLSGLELLRRVMDGRLAPPPMATTLDFALVEVEHGRVVFQGAPAEYMYNPLGSVHGGYAATLLDSAMGCAVHSALPAGQIYATAELKVNLVRPILARTGLLRAEGRLIHLGGRVGTSEGRLMGRDDGMLYAHGTTTCLVMPLKAG